LQNCNFEAPKTAEAEIPLGQRKPKAVEAEIPFGQRKPNAAEAKIPFGQQKPHAVEAEISIYKKNRTRWKQKFLFIRKTARG